MDFRGKWLERGKIEGVLGCLGLFSVIEIFEISFWVDFYG
jgi:hypothetical protein